MKSSKKIMPVFETAATVWSLIDATSKLYYFIEECLTTPDKRLKDAYDKAFNKAWKSYMPHDNGSSATALLKSRFKRKLFSAIEGDILDNDTEKFIGHFKIACGEDELIHKVSSKFEHDEILSTLENLLDDIDQLETDINTCINQINMLNISPFNTLKEDLGGLYKGDEYISDERIDATIKDIQSSTKPIRITALSGMGKTRLVYEAFKECDSPCYYTQVRDFEQVYSAIKRIIQSHNEACIFIVDDCSFDNHLELIKLQKSALREFRIITIYHDFDTRDSNAKRYIWRKDQFSAMLKRHIQSYPIPVDVANRILNISDNNPQLIFSFLKNMNDADYKISNEHDFFKRLVHLDEENAPIYQKILQFFAIFKPINIGEDYKFNSEEIKWLVNSNVMRVICCNFDEYNKQKLVEGAVTAYYQKELIEVIECYINIRPLPLVFWLINEWVISNRTGLEEIIETLQKEDSDAAKQLLKAIINRFNQMRYVRQGDKWIGELFESKTALFGPAKRIFSELGSNFLCSTVSVAPDAAFVNLSRNINEASFKTLASLDSDIRITLQHAISYYFTQSGKEKAAMDLMARLALSEGETCYGNNAKAALSELFQLRIPGTSLSLESRLEWLKQFAKKEEYRELVPQLIKSGLEFSSFTRASGYYEDQNEFTKLDYEPQSTTEAFNYNHSMWFLLVELTKVKIIPLEVAISIIKRRMYESLSKDMETPIFTVFEKLFDESTAWEKIRAKLKECIHSDDFDLKLSDNTINEMNKWIEKMRVDDLLSTYSDYTTKCRRAYIDARESDGATTENQIIEAESQRVAQEIVNLDWYAPKLISYLSDENSSIDTRLFVELGALYSTDEDKAYSVIDTCLSTCHVQEVEVNNMSWLMAFAIGAKQAGLVDRLTKKLCDLDYHQFLFGLYGAYYKEGDYVDLVLHYIDTVNALSPEGFNYYLRMLRNNYNDIVLSLYQAVQHKTEYCISSFFYIWLLVYGDKEINETDKLLEICQQSLILSISKKVQDSSKLKTVLTWTLSKNPDFARQYCERIIAFYKTKFELSDKLYHEKLLKIIAKTAPDKMWSFAKFFLSEPSIDFIIMTMSLDSQMFNSANGVLADLDSSKLIRIAHQHVQTGPRRLVKQFPLFNDEGDDLHELQLKLINEFPENKQMLREIGHKLRSMMGGASLVPIFEKRLGILEKLYVHPNKHVVEWAKKEAERFHNRIDYHKKDDAYGKIRYGK